MCSSFFHASIILRKLICGQFVIDFISDCKSEDKNDALILAFDVPPQEVLTKDSVTVSVDAVVYYRVCSLVLNL